MGYRENLQRYRVLCSTHTHKPPVLGYINQVQEEHPSTLTAYPCVYSRDLEQALQAKNAEVKAQQRKNRCSSDDVWSIWSAAKSGEAGRSASVDGVPHAYGFCFCRSVDVIFPEKKLCNSDMTRIVEECPKKQELFGAWCMSIASTWRKLNKRP